MKFILSVKDDSKISPLLHIANVGEKVNFSCDSVGERRWYYERINFVPTSKPVIEHVDSLFIRHVRSSHAGYFFCFGSDGHKHFLARANLIVYGELFEFKLFCEYFTLFYTLLKFYIYFKGTQSFTFCNNLVIIFQ